MQFIEQSLTCIVIEDEKRPASSVVRSSAWNLSFGVFLEGVFLAPRSHWVRSEKDLSFKTETDDAEGPYKPIISL